MPQPTPQGLTKCDPFLVRRGVRMAIWLLSSQGLDASTAHLQQGCTVLAHTHFLARQVEQRAAAAALPPRVVPLLRPFISPSVTALCRAQHHREIRGATRAERQQRQLVLVDSDSASPTIIEVLREACESARGDAAPRCTVKHVNGLSRSTVRELITRAIAVVDWCMVGAERLPIEAVLCGASLLTSHCLHGSSRNDLPIAPQLVLEQEADLVAAVARLLAESRLELSRPLAVEPLRRLYDAEIGPASLVREARAVIRALNVAQPIPPYPPAW